MEEHWEGLRVEAPASAICQIALPGRASHPSGPDLPTGNQGRRMVTLAPPLEMGEWGLGEITLRPEGKRQAWNEEGGPGPP